MLFVKQCPLLGWADGFDRCCYYIINVHGYVFFQD